MSDYQPDYNVYCERGDIDRALECLDEYGYCVIRKMIDSDWVEELKGEIDAVLDPQRDLAPAANRYHMMLAEESSALWRLVEHDPYMNYVRAVHGTDEVCLHRSAAILRTPGEGMGTWHTDHRGHVEKPQIANDVLNRFSMPSGSWFYLNGSDPQCSGIAVIEKSNKPDWTGPDGFELTPDRSSFRPIGAADDAKWSSMEVPGCIGVVADPGDLICFAALTYHANMATHARRYSCGMGFRPKKMQIDAPWPLPATATALIERLPDHLKTYADGYTGYDGTWRAEG
jgi:hypothetical protein